MGVRPWLAAVVAQTSSKPRHWYALLSQASAHSTCRRTKGSMQAGRRLSPSARPGAAVVCIVLPDGALAGEQARALHAAHCQHEVGRGGHRALEVGAHRLRQGPAL